MVSVQLQRCGPVEAEQLSGTDRGSILIAADLVSPSWPVGSGQWPTPLSLLQQRGLADGCRLLTARLLSASPTPPGGRYFER